jgi:hypothetical protein
MLATKRSTARGNGSVAERHRRAVQSEEITNKRSTYIPKNRDAGFMSKLAARFF